jgi:hypothetical protein
MKMMTPTMNCTASARRVDGAEDGAGDDSEGKTEEQHVV